MSLYCGFNCCILSVLTSFSGIFMYFPRAVMYFPIFFALKVFHNFPVFSLVFLHCPHFFLAFSLVFFHFPHFSFVFHWISLFFQWFSLIYFIIKRFLVFQRFSSLSHYIYFFFCNIHQFFFMLFIGFLELYIYIYILHNIIYIYR